MENRDNIWHFVLIFAWVALMLVLIIGVMKARWEREKRKSPEYWKRQPP